MPPQGMPPPGGRGMGMPGPGMGMPPAGMGGMPPADGRPSMSRSPGLQNNFYDQTTADFKRPHGGGGGMPSSGMGMDTDAPPRRDMNMPPPLNDLSQLINRAAEHEEEHNRKKNVANSLFQQQVSTLDVTSDVLPDLDKIMADCLKQAEEEVGQDTRESMEAMRASRSRLVDAARDFADSIARLDGMVY